MYDPRVGRFLSEDPIGFGAGDANLYRYVFNSPTNATDPSGLDTRVTQLVYKALITRFVQTNTKLHRRAANLSQEELTEPERLSLDIEKSLAPHAIKLAAEKALRDLKITGVTVNLGDWLKASISDDDYKKIVKQAGASLERVRTISADSAERIRLEGNWELKIYKKGGKYSISVGVDTDSWEHYTQAVGYMISGGGARRPAANSSNAEAYLGKHVFDYAAAVKLKGFLDEKLIDQEDYDSVVRNGVFLGYLGSDNAHFTTAMLIKLEQKYAELGIPGYPPK